MRNYKSTFQEISKQEQLHIFGGYRGPITTYLGDQYYISYDQGDEGGHYDPNGNHGKKNLG